MSSSHPIDRRFRRWLPPVWQIIAWMIGLAIAFPVEIRRYLAIAEEGRSPAAWLVDMNIDTTPASALLLLAPIVWFLPRVTILRRRWALLRADGWFGETTKPGTDRSRDTDLRDWILALGVAAASLVASIGVALAFGDLPPAYHDEYSYLFMAETFLEGRTWLLPHPSMPDLFDQMHVLNEGRLASRYFPGTGAWMAPFVWIGHPYWSHWLAGALCAFFIFWAGRELAGNTVGLLAGLLTAIAPALAIFSNLLLAHHPTLAGLAFFLFMFLRMMRTGDGLDAFFAGCGLAFAMLCRPMTAAGFGLPFGILLVGWVARGWAVRHLGFRLTRAAALGAPVVAGLVGMFVYNHSITGSPWTTPYEQYLNVYTPRHVYGFDNVVRGEQRLGDKVIRDYDEWAENLTPGLAARNVWRRLISSWQWTLGIVPLAMALAVFPRYATDHDRRWWLVFAAIVSLHAAHIPYWYEGILGWHYVFETGPLWLLLFAGSTHALFEDWQARRRAWMPVWWSGLIIASLLPQYFSIEPLWWGSRVGQEVQNISFSRRKHAAMQDAIEQFVSERPALVLVSQSLHELHIDYVINEQGLDAPVIRGRFRPGRTDFAKVLNAFPERSVYVALAESDDLTKVAEGPLRFEPAGSFVLPPGQVVDVFRIARTR